MSALSSEASQATTRAISSGPVQRPAGSPAFTLSVRSGSAQPVSTGPRLMALTVIPRSMSASDRHGKVLLINFRDEDYRRPLNEVRDSFWSAPRSFRLQVGFLRCCDQPKPILTCGYSTQYALFRRVSR